MMGKHLLINIIYSKRIEQIFLFYSQSSTLNLKNIALRSILTLTFRYTTLSLFMPKLTNPTNTDDHWSKGSAPAPFKVNRRMGIRYLRKDIGVSLRRIGLLTFSFRANHDVSVKLIDISSRGVLIATDIKLPVNKKVFLTIRFSDFKEFEILGKIVRKSEGAVLIYGIKFDKINNKLADKLLATQRKLSFT
jgi:PilZ domain